MALDDRDYYREELRRKQGLPPAWAANANRAYRKRRGEPTEPWLAPGMSTVEVDALLPRKRPAYGWLIAAACIGCVLIGYLAGFALSQAPVTVHPAYTPRPPMPRVLQ